MTNRSAQVVVAAAVALGLAASLGCSRYRPLEVGECLGPDAGVVGVRAEAPDVVPCSSPHRYEVFARQDLEPPSDAWPGEELVELNARRLCGVAVRDATGLDPGELPDGVRVVHVRPTESSWRDQGDREVECLFRWRTVTTDTLVDRVG